jgi:ribosomal-protein-alanine N-acetyltransferase
VHRENYCSSLLKPLKVIELTLDDLNEVIEIEQLSFPTPWSEGLFLQQLHSEFSKIFLTKSSSLEKQQVLGFICIWFVADEMHILNLACLPALRRQGIAAALLEHGLFFSFMMNMKKVFLEVRKSNYAAMSLYKKYCFRPIGIRKGYYTDTQEDAIVMALEMESSTFLDKSFPVSDK